MCWLVISPFCDFFAVLDVSFAVNLCINCSFLHLYLYKCKKKLLLYNNVSISIQQTKFCRDVSIGGWDITTSGFEIQTSAIFTFYFLFRPRPFRRNRRVILHPAAEFRPNRNIRRWRHIDFQDGIRQPCCICFGVMVDHEVPFVVWIPISNR